MTPRTLFSIVLKVLGLFFIKDMIANIPSLVAYLPYYLGTVGEVSYGALALFVLSIGLYVFIIYCLIFKSNVIIDKLQLTNGLGDEPIPFNLHRSSILSICVIIIGALMIINAVPWLLRQIFLYYQRSRLHVEYSKPDKTYIIVYIAEIVLGLLLMANQRAIVNFIEMKRRGNPVEESSEEE